MSSFAKRHIPKACIIALVVWLAGCSMPTPYQPAIDGLGYSEQSIENDRYRIIFAGNSQTPRSTVDNYLLYRIAELTLDRGFDHFILVEKDIERSTTYRSSATGFSGFHRGFYSYYPRRFGGFLSTTSRPSDRYAGLANVVMRKGEKPSDSPNAYSARDVLERLKPTIKRPTDRQS